MLRHCTSEQKATRHIPVGRLVRVQESCGHLGRARGAVGECPMAADDGSRVSSSDGAITEGVGCRGSQSFCACGIQLFTEDQRVHWLQRLRTIELGTRSESERREQVAGDSGCNAVSSARHTMLVARAGE